MTRELVEIQPDELKFVVELKKQSSCSIHLVNNSDQYVAYKVKTTNPKRYCVRPNIDVILPKSPCEIIVTMQAPRNPPVDMQCRDKFLIQSTVVTEGTTIEDVSSDLFAKGNGRVIEEKKLKVSLVSPAHSPDCQSINDVITQEPVYEAPSPALQPTNGVKSQEVVYETLSSVYEADSPIFPTIDSGKKREPVYEAHSPVLHPLNGVIKGDLDYEVVNPRERVCLSTERIAVPSQAVANDMEDLKAKWIEAEKTITRLREERTTIIRQRDAAQQELVVAKRRRTAQVRAGYPFLFVCFTALVGLLSGYMLHP